MTRIGLLHPSLPALVLVAAFACGGKQQEPARPEDPHERMAMQALREHERERQARAEAAANNEGPGVPPATWQCQKLLDHFLEVMGREHAAKVPPEQVPSEAQVAAIRDNMEADFLATCKTMSMAEFDCSMAATTSEGIIECSPLVEAEP